MDLSQYSNEELQAMLDTPEPAVVDLSGYSDAELEAMLGEEPQPPIYGGGLVSDLRAGLAGAGDMVTVGFGDELKGMLQGQVRGALDPNVSRKEATDFFINKARQEGAQLQEENPAAYLGGQVAGGLGTALSVPSSLTKGASYLAGKTIPRQLATAAGIGGVSGGVYAFGSGEGGTQDRLQGVPTGAAYGAAGGGVGLGLSKAARPLTELAKKLYKKPAPTQGLQGKPAQDVVEALVEKQQMPDVVQDSQKAMTQVSKQLTKDFGADLDQALGAYKSGDISLAELYGQRTSSLAKGAAVYPSGRAGAEDFFDKKVSGSYDRVLSAVRKNVSGVDNYFTTSDDLINAGRAKAAPQYATAYDDSVKDLGVLDIPEIQSALKTAYKKYPSELQDVSENSIKALDYAKRVLDDQIGKAKRAGEGNFARSRTQIKNQLLDVMDASSPSYKQARAIAGDYLSIDNAMEEGRKALKTESEALENVYKTLGKQEKQAYKIGLGKALRDEIGKVAEGANPYKKILGSPEKQKRIAAILSPEEFKNFERGLKAEDRLFRLRNEVLSGSSTAERTEAKALIEGGATEAITGIPQQTFIQGLKVFKTKLLDGIDDKTAAKVSDILYEVDPIKKLEILDGLGKSKDFTANEKLLVKRAYSLIAPKFDSLRISGAATGGAIATQLSEEQ